MECFALVSFGTYESVITEKDAYIHVYISARKTMEHAIAGASFHSELLTIY